MGRTKRRQIFLALGLLMLTGIAVHFRLWTIDYRHSSNDSDLLRFAQFFPPFFAAQSWFSTRSSELDAEFMCDFVYVSSRNLWNGLLIQNHAFVCYVWSVCWLDCRRQFDLASREAMDESAEWRRRFDLELEKAAKCSRELEEVCNFSMNYYNPFCSACLNLICTFGLT